LLGNSFEQIPIGFGIAPKRIRGRIVEAHPAVIGAVCVTRESDFRNLRVIVKTDNGIGGGGGFGGDIVVHNDENSIWKIPRCNSFFSRCGALEDWKFLFNSSRW